MRIPLLGAAILATQVFASVELQRVDVLRKEEGDFKRISEYFTGKENTGRRLIARSVEERRTGVYFALTIPGGVKELPAGAKVRVSIVTPEKAGNEVFLLTLPEARPAFGEIWVGLTEPRFANKALPITAWKVSVLNEKGEIITERKSFLWGD